MGAGADLKRNAMAITADRANQFMRGVGLEMHSRLVLRTPVDEGRARANWNASVGSEDGSEDPSATSANVGAKSGVARGVIRETDFFRGGKLFLTNGVPYIKKLEEGSSKQAPQGMIAVTVAELRLFVERIAGRIRGK